MTKEQIGEILKNLRIQSGKTQKQVAESIGRTQQVVGHWETGYAQPDANTLFKLCELYGVSVDNAFGFSKQKSPAQEGEADERKERLIHNYDAMNDEGQDALTKLSDDMIAGGRYKPDDDLVTYRLVARNKYKPVQEVKGKRIDPSKIPGITGDDF